jgi:hypothetical protein
MYLVGQGSLKDGTRAPVKRTTQEPQRHGNPFIVPVEVPVRPVVLPRPVREDTREKAPA